MTRRSDRLRAVVAAASLLLVAGCVTDEDRFVASVATARPGPVFTPGQVLTGAEFADGVMAGVEDLESYAFHVVEHSTLGTGEADTEIDKDGTGSYVEGVDGPSMQIHTKASFAEGDLDLEIVATPDGVWLKAAHAPDPSAWYAFDDGDDRIEDVYGALATTSSPLRQVELARSLDEVRVLPPTIEADRGLTLFEFELPLAEAVPDLLDGSTSEAAEDLGETPVTVRLAFDHQGRPVRQRTTLEFDASPTSVSNESTITWSEWNVPQTVGLPPGARIRDSDDFGPSQAA